MKDEDVETLIAATPDSWSGMRITEASCGVKSTSEYIAGYIMADLGRIVAFIAGAVILIFGITALIKGVRALLRMLAKRGFPIPMVIKRLFLLQVIYVKDNRITYESEKKRETVIVSELSAINYHYHAVVGFVAVWEFVARNGNAVAVGDETPGMRDVLAILEKRLRGFSLNKVQEEFKKGDVEDSIAAWRAEPR